MKQMQNENKKNEKNFNTYRCQICNRKLLKQGDICTKCYKDMKIYEEKGFANNEVLESLDSELIKGLSYKTNSFKIGKKSKDEKAFIIEYKYNYIKDNLIKRADFALIFLISFIATFANVNINTFVVFPVLILYLITIYLKHLYIKKHKESIKYYFLKDKLVMKTKFPFKKIKEIPYTKIDNIKEIRSRILPYTEICIYEKLDNSLIDVYKTIRIENIEKSVYEDLISIIIAITKFEGKDTEYTPMEYLGESFKGFREELKELSKNIKEKK